MRVRRTNHFLFNHYTLKRILGLVHSRLIKSIEALHVLFKRRQGSASFLVYFIALMVTAKPYLAGLASLLRNYLSELPNWHQLAFIHANRQ